MNTDTLIQQTRSILESWSGASCFVEEGDGYWEVTFPAALESEYQFIGNIYTDGDLQICAVRKNAPEDESFWYKPYEEPDYESLELMHGTFLWELNALLSNKTRILHKRGMLFGSFTCEFKMNEDWKNIGGASYFKFDGCNPPLVRGGVQAYQSDAVRSETQQDARVGRLLRCAPHSINVSLT